MSRLQIWLDVVGVVLYYAHISAGAKPTVPTEDIAIYDHQGEYLQDVIGPFDEGSHLALVCEVPIGDPLPSVSWWRDFTLIDNSSTVTSQGFVRNEIVFSRLQRSDLMAVLMCQASFGNITLQRSKSVTLDMKFKPLDVRITTLQRPLSAGKRVTLTCQSSGSRPPAELTWWKGSRRIRAIKEVVSNDSNVLVSTMTFIPKMDDNGKRIMCRACNPFLPDSALEDYWMLNVYYVPQLRLVFGANIQHTSIREHDNVYFDCNIQANPWVTEVGWRFKNRPLFSNPSLGLIISNYSLLIQNVQKHHQGLYQCIAANIEGDGESEPVALRIHYVPTCKAGQKEAYSLAMQETAYVKCEVDANPPDVKFHWIFNSSVVSVKIKTFTTNRTMSAAKFVPRTKLGYGYLICQAKNIIGVQAEPCLFKIVPAGQPESVKDCKAFNETTTSISVICEAGYDGGLPPTYHLELYNSMTESIQQNLTSTDKPLFTAKDLPVGTVFLLLLYVTNTRGRSDSVALTSGTLVPADRLTGEIRRPVISPVLGVLIGIVSGLVLAAVVVVVRIREDVSEELDKPHSRSLHSRI